MIISIVSCDINFGIGKDNHLLFSLPADMKYFRESTKGHVVAMGKKTLLSLPNSKPLKNRTNIVLTHHLVAEDGLINVGTLEELLGVMQTLSVNETVFVIGGASVYKDTLPYVDEVWITKVEADGHADVFFPNIDKMPEFECYSTSDPIIDNGYEIRFKKYKNLAKR